AVAGFGRSFPDWPAPEMARVPIAHGLPQTDWRTIHAKARRGFAAAVQSSDPSKNHEIGQTNLRVAYLLLLVGQTLAQALKVEKEAGQSCVTGVRLGYLIRCA